MADTAQPVAPPVEVVERKAQGPQNEGEEICHLVEAHDPDTALCGKDVSGYPWNPPWPFCVVCIDLAQGLPHWQEQLRSIGLGR
jgi:hypothetical protein